MERMYLVCRRLGAGTGISSNYPVHQYLHRTLWLSCYGLYEITATIQLLASLPAAAVQPAAAATRAWPICHVAVTSPGERGVICFRRVTRVSACSSVTAAPLFCSYHL